MDTIQAAVTSLNVDDDSQWTEDGLPVLEIIQEKSGIADLTREQLNEAAPGFTRETFRAFLDSDSTAPTETLVAPIAPVVPEVEKPKGQSNLKNHTSEEKEAQENLSSSDKQKLQDRLDVVRSAKAKVNEEKHKIEVRLQEIIAEEDALIDAMSTEVSHLQLTEAIQGYQKTQKAILANRAMKMKAVQESGINFNELLKFKAPVDQSRANRRRR